MGVCTPEGIRPKLWTQKHPSGVKTPNGCNYTCSCTLVGIRPKLWTQKHPWGVKTPNRCKYTHTCTPVGIRPKLWTQKHPSGVKTPNGCNYTCSCTLVGIRPKLWTQKHPWGVKTPNRCKYTHTCTPVGIRPKLWTQKHPSGVQTPNGCNYTRTTVRHLYKHSTGVLRYAVWSIRCTVQVFPKTFVGFLNTHREYDRAFVGISTYYTWNPPDGRIDTQGAFGGPGQTPQGSGLSYLKNEKPGRQADLAHYFSKRNQVYKSEK